MNFHKNELQREANPAVFYWEFPRCGALPKLGQPKIIYRTSSISMQAAYDTSHQFHTTATHSIPTTDLSLLAILNSRLFSWYACKKYNKFPKYKPLAFSKQNMKNAPIVPRTDKEKEKLSDLVQQILEAPDSPKALDIEREIDALVYDLYELTTARDSIDKGGIQPMKVLVIGGTGNISRGIVAALQHRNYEIVLFNRGQHRDPPPSDIRIIHGDRQQRDDFEAKVGAEEWDAVIDMISFNAEDAASALRACQGRIGHFVHCSTVMTYGPPFSGINLPETAPLQGESGYGRGKVAADNLLLEAHARDGIPCDYLQTVLYTRPGHESPASSRWRRELD